MSDPRSVISGLSEEQANAVKETIRWAAQRAGWEGAAAALEAFADRMEGATIDANSEEYAAGAAEAFRLASESAREQAKAIRAEQLE